MRLATSSCNPLCQDRRNITDTFLRAAVPMRFVKAGCKAKWQERHTKSKNIRAASTVRTRPHKSGAAPNVTFFFPFWNWNRALATVSCAFCRPHFPKVLWTLRFFNILKCKPSSRYNPVHFLSTTFPDRGPHPQTETPLRPPRKPLYPTKTQGFAPESLFTREFTRSRTVTLSNYDGWLTWWCGWHDGGNASPHNRP